MAKQSFEYISCLEQSTVYRTRFSELLVTNYLDNGPFGSLTEKATFLRTPPLNKMKKSSGTRIFFIYFHSAHRRTKPASELV